MRVNRMLLVAVLLGVMGPLCLAQEKFKVTVPPEPQGMERMFDGKSLEGWDGDPRLWSVKDGAIRGETTKENPARGNTFLIWKGGTVKDFDLRLNFRVSRANNSGIQYRSRQFPNTKGNQWIVGGYQGEVRNSDKVPSVSGFIYDERGKRGRMCMVGEKAIWENGKKNVVGTLCTAQDFANAFKVDEWNEYVIIAKGNTIKQYINGLQVVEFTDNDPQLALKEGIIALQLHGGAPMWAEFKDLRVKRD